MEESSAPKPVPTLEERLADLTKRLEAIELHLFHEAGRAKIKLLLSKEKK